MSILSAWPARHERRHAAVAQDNNRINTHLNKLEEMIETAMQYITVLNKKVDSMRAGRPALSVCSAPPVLDEQMATRESGLDDLATHKVSDSDDETASRESGLHNQATNRKNDSDNQTPNKESDPDDQTMNKENDPRPPTWWKDVMKIGREKTAAEVDARLTAMAAKSRQRDVCIFDAELGEKMVDRD